MSDYPGGHGPWFVALLFNTSEHSKKQTHLLAHTLPHLAVDVLNKTTHHRENRKNCWVLMIKVGPFDRWSDAIFYLNMWNAKTRGRIKRLERGIDLFKQYHQTYHLTMWVQTRTKNEVIETFYHNNAFADDKKHKKRKKADIRIMDLLEQERLFSSLEEATIGKVKMAKV